MRLLLLLGGERSLSRKADGALTGAVRHQALTNDDPAAVVTTRRQSSLGPVCFGHLSRRPRRCSVVRGPDRVSVATFGSPPGPLLMGPFESIDLASRGATMADD